MDDQAFKYRSMDDWFNTSQGSRVALAFSYELGCSAELIKGENLLQLGSCGENIWLSMLDFQHKLIVTPYIDKQKSILTASLRALPIDRNSVDCIIAPFTMEAFSWEKNPLNEIDRILKPMGYVIFFGINPFSFWGIALRMGKLACLGHSRPTFASSLSLIHTMSVHGYQQCFHKNFHYIPPR